MRNEWIGRRQAVRQTCHMRAEMRFLDGRVPIECMVIDISATGARVELPEGFDCPEDFDLFIPSRSETKIAKMRRQEDNVAGIAFLKSRHEDPMAMQSIIERLARLERGYNELRKAGMPAADGERRNDEAPAEPPLLIAAAPELLGAGTAHFEQRLDALAESLADLQTTFVMSIARREPQTDHSTDIQVLKSQIADLTAVVNANMSANPDTSVPTAHVAAMMAPVVETQQEVVELKSEMERLSVALGALIAPAAGDHEPVLAASEAPAEALAQTSVPASAEDHQQTQSQLMQLKAELAELRTAIPQQPAMPRSAAPAAVASDVAESGQLEGEVRDLRDSVRTLIMLVAKSLNEKPREAA